MSSMSLVEALGVTLADLMPPKGVVVSAQREVLPYRISERLHDALREQAKARGESVSNLFTQLRDEIHSAEREVAGKER